MKKTIFLAAVSLICFAGFSQSNAKDLPPKDQPAPAAPANKQSQQYFILLSQQEILSLFDFVNNADIYSDKGRGLYLDFLKKHTYPVPAQKDSLAGEGTAAAKAKKKP